MICIKNYDEVNSRTTIGKVYDILEESYSSTGYDTNLYFIADNGDELWYDSDHFISLEEHRENQLKKIGL